MALNSERILKVKTFINSIPLKGRRVTDPPPRQADPIISGSNGVITTANVPDEKRPWVYDSYLFSELAANAKVNKQKDPIQWYSVFSDTLVQLGWVSKNFDFSNYHPTGSELTVAKVVIDVLAAIADGKQQEALKVFIESLQADGDSVTFFQSKTFNNKKGQFCISPCDADASTGELALSIGAFNGTFSENATNFFFGTWKSTDVKLQTAAQVLSIDEDIFREVYPDIKARLVPFVDSNIHRIKLKM